MDISLAYVLDLIITHAHVVLFGSEYEYEFPKTPVCLSTPVIK